MHIVVFDAEPWERDTFDRWKQNHTVKVSTHPLRRASSGFYPDAEIISVFVYSRVDADVLNAMPQLKLITTRSTGTDHIDLAECARRGILVCNVPDYGRNTVAEHVFALLLALSHRIIEASDRTRRGDFSTRDLQGFDLFDKTMGIIGTGKIGTETIRIARGFGMHVLANDIFPSTEKANRYGFHYVTLAALLENSDVVSLHVPATEQTHQLLGASEFERMKQDAVLINTARGDVVDIRALAQALASGKLAGAGLDVLPHEPVIREEAELLRAVYERQHDLGVLLANEVLCHMRNVVVTPHSAFNTKESVQRILETTHENIAHFLEGQAQHVVMSPSPEAIQLPPANEGDGPAAEPDGN